MISNDCRCPGCGTCGAAQEAAPLRKSLREAKQKYAELSRMNEGYIKHLHAAERERDELKAEVERLRGILQEWSYPRIYVQPGAEREMLLAQLGNNMKRNAATEERERIFHWIRARAAHTDDRVSMREKGVMIDIANAIERGEHEK